MTERLRFIVSFSTLLLFSEKRLSNLYLLHLYLEQNVLFQWWRNFLSYKAVCRTVVKFEFTCSLDLHTHNKLVTLWVICINHRPVNPWHQGPIISPYWQSWHEKAILQFRKKLIATTNYVYQRLLLLGHIVHCKI